MQLTLNNQTIDSYDITSISWTGNNSYDSFVKSSKYEVLLYTGEVILVERSSLDDTTFEVLKDVHFAG